MKLKKISKQERMTRLIYDAIRCQEFRAKNPGWVRDALQALEKRFIPPCTCEFTAEFKITTAYLGGIYVSGEDDCDVHGMARAGQRGGRKKKESPGPSPLRRRR